MAASSFTLMWLNVSLIFLLVGMLVLRPPMPYTGRDLLVALLPFMALLAAIALSTLVSAGPAALVQATHLHRLVLLPPLMLLMLPHVNLRRMLQAWCVLMILSGLYGTLQMLTGLDPFYPLRPPLGAMNDGVYRARGGFNEIITYSDYMLMAAPVLAVMACAEQGRWRLFWAAGAFGAVLAPFVSVTRSGVVGLVVATLVLAFRWNARVAAVASAAALLGVVSLIVARPTMSGWLQDAQWVQQTPVLNRLTTLDPTRDQGIQDRLLIWESGLLGLRDRPLLGFGIRGHQAHLPSYERRVLDVRGWYDYKPSVGFGSELHSNYVGVLFQLGLVGFMVYLYLWGSVCWAIGAALRTGPAPGSAEAALLWGIAAALAGSMAAGFFEDSFFDGEVQTLILTLMALALFLSRQVRWRAALRPQGEWSNVQPSTHVATQRPMPRPGPRNDTSSR